MAWFKKVRKPIEGKADKSRVPEGLWVKCPSCAQIIYNKDLVASLSVCTKCGHHFRLSASERLRTLFDGEWEEHDAGLTSTDPLKFTDTKSYRQRLESSMKSTGLRDAVISASGHVGGMECIVAAMEYGFIGGSMGVVVGEKITRAIERALSRQWPIIIVSCSGGARMMEGALSLMQMAKISAALARLDRARLPYISMLTDPDDWRCDGQLCDARRHQHRGTKGAHRLCRSARDRADDPPEAAGGISAQRVPDRARDARRGRRST